MAINIAVLFLADSCCVGNTIPLIFTVCEVCHSLSGKVEAASIPVTAAGSMLGRRLCVLLGCIPLRSLIQDTRCFGGSKIIPELDHLGTIFMG